MSGRGTLYSEVQVKHVWGEGGLQRGGPEPRPCIKELCSCMRGGGAGTLYSHD